DTWYWRLIETGRSGVPARPFLRPALNNNIDSVQDGFVTDFKDQLDKEIAR
ncbi:HK97-gp10 family putative phage morphogenesis protein, partial [Escherichia coli]|uniref:HK97-gp10 family putative phage morphogenesis protein n=1 Tax=Escherichia coli TaxID=562 RepID=UPI003FA538CA